MADYRITTRALDATDTKPRRIKARASTGEIVEREYPHGNDGDVAHRMVADGLARQIQGGEPYALQVINVERADGYDFRVMPGMEG